MRWLVHVFARLAITATCTSSAAALEVHVEPGRYFFSTTSLRERLMPNSSEFMNGSSNWDSSSDRASRSDFADGNLARASRLELVDANSPPGTTMPDDHPIPGRFNYFMEGFLLFGALIHMPAAFPFEPRPTKSMDVTPERTSPRERRASIALVSSRTTSGGRESGCENAHERTEGAGCYDSLPLNPDRPRGSWLTRRWSAVTSRWTNWDRERGIKKAVAALAEFDDRTLRDMGIPSRSQIEHIVRYCREC